MSMMMVLVGLTTKGGGDASDGLIGVSGSIGFGVGTCPDPKWLSDLKLTPMDGTNDPAHPNYGNYQHENGGVSVFIPKYFYKIGSGTPHFSKYGLNSIDIKGVDTFSSEAEANNAGYALHRAFIDDGKEKPGFFYDKYLASKDGAGSCKSSQGAHPISLTTSSSYEPSSTMSGCTGILADSVVIARGRGYGWNAPSIFMIDAIAKISLAHAQSSTSDDYCAWHDPNGQTNFPKGCNSNLKDHNDPSVTFQSSYDQKPLTGSASNLAKTTHNGQESGVSDVNGAMYQVGIGLTVAGTSPTASTQVTSGDGYVLKKSAKHADITGGWGGPTDAWGSGSSLSSMFDFVPGLATWKSATGWVNFGNAGNQVFSGGISGVGYVKSCSGIQDSANSMSSDGLPLFGNDGCYQSWPQNLVPLASGYWTFAGQAGVFCRYWRNRRSVSSDTGGFRGSAYGE